MRAANMKELSYSMDFRTFIFEALNLSNGNTCHPEKQLQTIHLQKVFKKSDQTRFNLKKELVLVQKELNSVHLDRRAVMTSDWAPTSKKVERLGLEKIQWFLEGLIELKKKPTFIELIDFDLLNANLRKWLLELEEAAKGLENFGYFNDSGDDNTNLLKNKNVLIVEDMSYNRILLKKILER